jgi:NhaP-type Na+/H+ or K+/H+ antiporter
MAILLFLLIRPLATMVSLTGTSVSRRQRVFMAWFGVRGIGSVYYLAYALSHGLSGQPARAMADATLVVVAASIVVHGLSVTPLMRRYSRSDTRTRARG